MFGYCTLLTQGVFVTQVDSNPACALSAQWSRELLPMTCQNMQQRRIFAWLVLGLTGLVGMQPSTLLGQVSAPESVRKLKAGPGLEVMLWASEPMLANPTNIDIDSRGKQRHEVLVNLRIGLGEGLELRVADERQLRIANRRY